MSLNQWKLRFPSITGLDNKRMKSFINKIVRNRNYLVHANKKQINHQYNHIEYLHISLILDYLTITEILAHLNISKSLIDLIKEKAKSRFNFQQNLGMRIVEENDVLRK